MGSKKSQSFLGKANKWAKRAIAGTLGATMLYIGATSVNYYGEILENHLNPSQVSQEFNREFNIPISGAEEELEENSETISKLASVVHGEKLQKPFYLNDIHFTSDSIFDKSPLGHIAEMESWIREKRVTGGYNKVTDILELVRDGSKETMHHEIKHNKHQEILQENPEFNDKWRALGDAEYGDLYDKAREEGTISGKELQRFHEKGFVTPFAGSEIDEDIAEVGEMAETNPHRLYRLAQEHTAIEMKVKLAQEYDLIESETLEYCHIVDINEKAEDVSDIYTEEKQKELYREFLGESEDLLEDHSQSVYEADLRKRRGDSILSVYSIEGGSLSSSSESEESVREAIQEYKKGLKSDYKAPEDYKNILYSMHEVYNSIGESKKAESCRKAIIEYESRKESGDLSISKRGVNDILQREGVLGQK